MKFSFLVSTAQLKSKKGTLLGIGTNDALLHLAELMHECGMEGNIYDLPIGSKIPDMASPFSLSSGFALTTDLLNLLKIPELKQSPSQYAEVKKMVQRYETTFGYSERVNYSLVRSIAPWVLEKCYTNFKSRLSFDRLKEYQAFLRLARYWIHHYSLYEVYKEKGVDLTQPEFANTSHPVVQEFIEKNSNRLNFHKYLQFLCYEQRKAILKEFRKLEMRLILNLPFGVDINSADVFFHPDVFYNDLQVGAPPEPEHGYPEQLWGIAAFNEKSDALRQYLKEKMTWLSYLGDGVFLDHLVGWCGQYLIPFSPSSSPEEGEKGCFITENQEEREENLTWFLNIVLDSGLIIQGETLGDRERVVATNRVLEKLAKEGKQLSVMSIPRWENHEGKPKPLRNYECNSLIMVGTHDTPTLLQYLTNKKGVESEFENPEQILAYTRRVLGLPFQLADIPLKVEELTQEFCFAIIRRLVQGTQAEEIVFPLPVLISFLASNYRNTSVNHNINIQPGTSGVVDNPTGNWSYFSPPIEVFAKEDDLRLQLKALGKREFKPFDYFHELACIEGDQEKLFACYSDPTDREIVYRNKRGDWDVLTLPNKAFSSLPIFELTVMNMGTHEAWGNFFLGECFSWQTNVEYHFTDLNQPDQTYRYFGKELSEKPFFVKLLPEKRHHFLVTTITCEEIVEKS